MKTCTVCKEQKDLKEFHLNRKRKDGRQSKCKGCSKTLFQTYYKLNGPKHRTAVHARTKEIRRENRQKLLTYFQSHPCVDCGESDVVVLEFDHVRGRKRKDVSRLLLQGYGWAALIKEIEKCEVVCANCHRRRTYRRSRTYRVCNSTVE